MADGYTPLRSMDTRSRILNNKTMEPVCSMDKSGHRKGSLDRIPNSVFNTPCDVCGKTGGAILCCSNSKCKSVFHPTCAKNEGFTWPLRN